MFFSGLYKQDILGITRPFLDVAEESSIILVLVLVKQHLMLASNWDPAQVQAAAGYS